MNDGLDVARATLARLHIANAADVELGGHDETAGRNAARNDVLAPRCLWQEIPSWAGEYI